MIILGSAILGCGGNVYQFCDAYSELFLPLDDGMKSFHELVHPVTHGVHVFAERDLVLLNMFHDPQLVGSSAIRMYGSRLVDSI